MIMDNSRLIAGVVYYMEGIVNSNGTVNVTTETKRLMQREG